MRSAKRHAKALLAVTWLAGGLMASLPGPAGAEGGGGSATQASQGPERANGRRKRAGETGTETFLVDLEVNGTAVPGVFRAERLTDGRLALSGDAWEAARLRPSGAAISLPDGFTGHALDDVSGLAYRLDRDRMRLAVTA